MQKDSFLYQITSRCSRLLHARNIVIVSKHTVDHYALSARTQCVVALAVLVTVGVASFSTGQYLQARKMIKQKDNAIMATNAEKHKLSSDYSLLKNDLLRLTSETDTSDEHLSDYTQFILEQYQENATALESLDADLEALQADAATKASPALLRRIKYLEQQLQERQAQHEAFLKQVHLLTRNKIKAIEKAVEMTGMEEEISSFMERSLTPKMDRMMQGIDNDAQGGPFLAMSLTAAQQQPNHDTVLRDITLLSAMSDLADEIPWRRPMRGARFTSGFGKRLDPIHRTLARHTGIDYAGKIGAKVYATAGGRVSYSGYKGAYGRVVDINHGNGFVTRYAHLSRQLVNQGMQVRAGQIIGVQGTTGRSTGHHLHYEVRYNGTPINPARFVKAGKYVSKKLNQDG